VSGGKTDAEALREEIAGVLSTMGLRLSDDKTLITHIDDGLDLLGLHMPTSGLGCPASPSGTYAPSPGARSSAGYAANTPASPGRNYDDASASIDGGPPTAR